MKKIYACIMAMVLSIFLLPGLAGADNLAAAGADAFAGAVAAPTNNASFNGGDNFALPGAGIGAARGVKSVSIFGIAVSGTEPCYAKMDALAGFKSLTGLSIDSYSAAEYLGEACGIKIVNGKPVPVTVSTSGLKQPALKTATASTKAISPKPVMRPENRAKQSGSITVFDNAGMKRWIRGEKAIAAHNAGQPVRLGNGMVFQNGLQIEE